MKITLIKLMFFITVALHAQNIKKSKFIVMPGDNWMTEKGYKKVINNQGVASDVFDYSKALQENFELTTAVSSVEGVLKDRGLQVENLAERMKGITRTNAENLLNTSKTGATTTQSGFDRLMNTAKPDIIIYVDYKITTTGPKRILSLRISATDSYTFEAIGSANNSSAPTFSEDTNTLVRETVASIIDPFMNTIENHVNDTFENGRKVLIQLKKFDSWDGDFEKEYNGLELKEIVENWMREKAVKEVYNLDSPSENAMDFTIRIPLNDENGRATNATTYGRLFQKFIKEAPYAITAKVREIGLGRCMIMLGEK